MTVTELVPRPDLKPQPAPPKVKFKKPVVLPKVAPPVSFPTAKLFVPKDIRPQEEERGGREGSEARSQVQGARTGAADERDAGEDRVYGRVWQLGSGDGQRSHPAGADRRIRRSERPEGTGQGQRPSRRLPSWGRLICRKARARATERAERKGSRARLRARVSETGSRRETIENHGASVQTAGFGAQELSHGGPKVVQADSGPATTQVEIISKPSPVYTQEARQLKLEGEVLLEVMFGANGQLHVNRVVRGLGHGLDEAAVTAASQMRFKPAQRLGTPVDSTAIVHVVFQLAY